MTAPISNEPTTTVTPLCGTRLKRELLKAGFVARQGKGDHAVWSKDGITVVITQTREVARINTTSP